MIDLHDEWLCISRETPSSWDKHAVHDLLRGGHIVEEAVDIR
jgi:hypothetical protein